MGAGRRRRVGARRDHHRGTPPARWVRCRTGCTGRQGDGADMTAGDLGRVLVCVPTYNERDNIEVLLSRLRAAVPDADVLVIDDGSPDGTGKIVDALAEDDERIHVLHRTEKNGLGAAYIAGFDW